MQDVLVGRGTLVPAMTCGSASSVGLIQPVVARQSGQRLAARTGNVTTSSRAATITIIAAIPPAARPRAHLYLRTIHPGAAGWIHACTRARIRKTRTGRWA